MRCRRKRWILLYIYIYKICRVWLIYYIFIYVLNISGWQTLKIKSSAFLHTRSSLVYSQRSVIKILLFYIYRLRDVLIISPHVDLWFRNGGLETSFLHNSNFTQTFCMSAEVYVCTLHIRVRCFHEEVLTIGKFTLNKEGNIK